MAQFRSALTTADFMTGTVACTQGLFTRLGARVIQAGELLSLGFGNQSGQQDAQGRIFVDIRDNTASPGAVVPGVVRLTVYTPQDRPLVILAEFRVETLNQNSADRTKQLPFPESIYQLSEDKKLVIEFKPDATATISNANTKMVIDITEVQA
ncbi:MAG: hypothetical protein Q8906_06000 [Bacillota bacterium]|nr:hypothetical protein [Bacillota bacterium]